MLGGNGGQGGRGVECFIDAKFNGIWDQDFCEGKQTARAADGPAGKNGAPGSSKFLKWGGGEDQEEDDEKGDREDGGVRRLGVGVGVDALGGLGKW